MLHLSSSSSHPEPRAPLHPAKDEVLDHLTLRPETESVHTIRAQLYCNKQRGCRNLRAQLHPRRLWSARELAARRNASSPNMCFILNDDTGEPRAKQGTECRHSP